MKKIAIITIVDNINFGTYLQAFATAYAIKELGCQPEIINYERSYISPKQVAKKYLENKSMGVKKYGYAFFYRILYPFMVWQVKRFLKKNVLLTRPYKNISQLRTNPPLADIYITGSDQVWNSDYNNGIDESFFLDFVDAPKCAYAASVGINSFNDSNTEYLYSLLSKYKYISVRESFGIDALSQIGIDNVTQVLDPTLLFTKDTWLSITKIPKRKAVEKYLLIYSVETERNAMVLEQAVNIARFKNLKIYWVCPTCKFKKDLPNVDKIYNFASVETFLSLMVNAEFIVASSFHGTAFAINFNKEFLSVSPGKYNSRVCSLLRLCKLEDRYVSDKIMNIEEMHDINYDNVNSILNLHRKTSINYLRKILEV
ncbi:polysaccharide pyruvyl transferase family protein [uncultured Bacteroides sp.]|uniref:polysaccharide pyruvyl transferase family protein n=1 Tax=uncultured Bacteroides sp. TaxID=162156 RepID=UPI00262DFFA0|nr:polysaccharide pyruvyl transferase family protein [uncultured Bacteroides sp.]